MPSYTPQRRFHLIALSGATLSTDILILLASFVGFLNYKYIPWTICIVSCLLIYYKRVYIKRDKLIPNILYAESWKSIIVITIAHLHVLLLAEKFFCWYDGNQTLHPYTVFHFVFLYSLLPSTIDLWITYSDKNLYYEGHEFPSD
ncbi:unnamed protein product [Caenorhabditis brenneri]